jgi:hypothetical protein
MYLDWVEAYPKDARELLRPGSYRKAELLEDPWAFGPWCLHLAEVRLLPEPLPCRGMLGLWAVPVGPLTEALDRLIPTQQET